LHFCGDGGLFLPCYYRVIRNGEVNKSEEDQLKAVSLQKVKENVDVVRRGDVCGLGLDGLDDIKEGDIVECHSDK
jgi:translation initiation factor IF-2